MSIFISAVEVGSVRVLIPVCHEFIRSGYSVLIERRGYFAEEEIDELAPFYIDHSLDTDEDLRLFLENNCIKVLLFSVNVSECRPLRIARVAQAMGIYTVHLLDYWNGYKARMELDGEAMFQPTSYLVPDEYARQQAASEGILMDLIKVVGQPAFAKNGVVFRDACQQGNPFESRVKNGIQVLLFVLEPVLNDQGSSVLENSSYRGYTEKDVIQMLVSALKSVKRQFFVVVLPHPRQNVAELEGMWHSSGGDFYGEIQSKVRGRDLLPFVQGVVGMASTLLYEAGLGGKPVLSIQPGLRNDSLRMLQGKSGVEFIDQYVNAEVNVGEWLSELTAISFQQSKLRSELSEHELAPMRIVEEISELMGSI